MGGKNVNNICHVFLCALAREDTDKFYFSQENYLEGDASNWDAEIKDNDGYKSKESNALGSMDAVSGGVPSTNHIFCAHDRSGDNIHPHIRFNDGCHNM